MAVSNQMTITIRGDASSLQSALKLSESQIKQFTTTTETAGNSGTNAFGKIKGALIAIGSAAVVGKVVDGIKNIVSASVEAYGTYEQLVGGVESMFGGYENGAEQIESVINSANNAWQDLTLSQNDYFTAFTSTYPLMKADIEDQNEAIAQTNRLLTLESDLSNTFGYSMETATNAVNWALKGSFNYIDNLNIGIKGTQEGFLEAAHKAGYMVDSVQELTSSDILDIIEKTASEYGVLGKTAEEASTTIQGSTKAMKASWENLLTAMASGEGIDSAINNLISAVGTFAKNIIPVVKNALAGIVTLIAQLAPVIVEQLPLLVSELLPSILEALSNLVLQLVPMLPGMIETLFNAVLEILPSFIERLGEVIPQILSLITEVVIRIAQALSNPDTLSMILQSAIKALMQIVLAIPQIITSLYDALPGIIDGVIQFLTDPATIQMLLEAAVTLFFALVQAVPKILGSLLGAFGSIIGSLWDGIKRMFGEFAGKFGEFISGIFKGAINGVLGFIEGFINAPIKLINGFIDIINGAFGFVGVNLGRIGLIQLPRLEQGGIIPGNSYNGDHQLARVNSGEMVINRQQQAALWEAISTGNYEAGNTVGDIYINVDATGQSNPEGIAVEIAKAMKRAFDNQGIKPNLAYAGSLR